MGFLTAVTQDMPDALLGTRTQGVVLGALHQLEITHCGQLQAQVLPRLGSPVDNCHIQYYVVLMYGHVCLSIDWI